MEGGDVEREAARQNCFDVWICARCGDRCSRLVARSELARERCGGGRPENGPRQTLRPGGSGALVGPNAPILTTLTVSAFRGVSAVLDLALGVSGFQRASRASTLAL